ncbi:MAG: hypothetical protein II119_01715 [Bacilli bacterium]|jgi:uncharacterized membrane protein YvbJ|nr:hypothetical protein [Bacilli bacterium]MBQ6282240.1 hypothetical protein [Bacilli bacterium]
MKCPKCGQEMIDIKDYCVNCGAKLKKESKGISLKALLLIFGLIIVVTVIACYLIMHYNTDKEIKPYIDNTKNNSVEK